MTIVIPVFVFGKDGGFRVLSGLASYFTNKKHRTIFLAPQSTCQPYYPTDAVIYWYDSKGRLSEQQTGGSKHISTSLLMMGLYKAICRLANSEKIDIVLANFYLTAFPIWLARPANAALFYYIQAYEPEAFENKKGISNRLGYLLSKWSYALPFQKVVNANHYCNYKEIKTNRVVFPGLNLQLYHPAGRRSFMADGVLRIGTVGRTGAWKGTAQVVTAYRQLCDLQLPIELHMAFGDETMAENLPNVVIVQPHGDKNLASFYKQIDVYVSAVLVDGPAIHYPVVEAMACGTPVITTNLYPADTSNAIIVDSKQRVTGIKAGIRQLIQVNDNKERDLRVANAYQSTQQFDWKVSGNKMLDYFEAQIKKHHKNTLNTTDI